MRTDFSPSQLTDPHLAAAEKSLRSCVHCGICTATCPTYVLLGDERDGPRGRIVMMQNMLEAGRAPDAETVLHVDRCLSCLACSTACPSGVDYARLVDAARVHIQSRYRRPLGERLLRWLIAHVAAYPSRMQMGIGLARAFAPIVNRLPGRLGVLARLGTKQSRHTPSPQSMAPKAHRVALMPGCAQAVLAPQIDAAAAQVLARRDIGLVPLPGAGCCGALSHHLGRSEEAKAWGRRAISAFEQAGGAVSFEGVLITATGCAAHLKDLGHIFAGDPVWHERAQMFARSVRDFSGLTEPRGVAAPRSLRVAWQAPCSLQNSLKLADAGRALLVAAGYDVVDIAEGHLCCGSAGSYSILQPDIAQRLRRRKLDNIARLSPDVIATANIGCLQHLSGSDAPPVVHLAELLDYAEGGPAPEFLAKKNALR